MYWIIVKVFFVGCKWNLVTYDKDRVFEAWRPNYIFNDWIHSEGPSFTIKPKENLIIAIPSIYAAINVC